MRSRSYLFSFYSVAETGFHTMQWKRRKEIHRREEFLAVSWILSGIQAVQTGLLFWAITNTLNLLNTYFHISATVWPIITDHLHIVLVISAHWFWMVLVSSAQVMDPSLNDTVRAGSLSTNWKSFLMWFGERRQTVPLWLEWLCLV